ncbi:unnamed protein product, partial [Gulo gulo]
RDARPLHPALLESPEGRLGGARVSGTHRSLEVCVRLADEGTKDIVPASICPGPELGRQVCLWRASSHYAKKGLHVYH